MGDMQSQPGILKISICPKSSKRRIFAQDLTNQLDSLIAAIRAIEDRDGEVEILSLSMRSPLTAELRILDKVKAPARQAKQKGQKDLLRKNPRAPGRAVATFIAHMSGSVINFDYLTAESLINVGKSLRKNDSTLTMRSDDSEVQLDSGIVERIESQIGKRSKGPSIQSGFVGSITALGRQPIMRLVDPLDHAHKLKCLLRPEDAAALGGALLKHVEVSGIATWTDKSYDPVQMEVSSFRVLEPLPDRALDTLLERMQSEISTLNPDQKRLLSESWGGWD